MSINDFVRERILTFPVLLLYLMNFARKSLQVCLNSFFEKINLPSITKQAFSKARKKFSSQTFVLLNRKLLEEYYTDNEYATWKGFRLIAIDGSDLQLPQTKNLRDKFGCAKNSKGPNLVMGQLSCAYDILNNMTLDAKIDHCNSSERDLAVAHIESIQQLHHDETKNLYIFDRGYPSLGLLFYLKEQKQDFLMRASFTCCFSAIRKRLEEGCTDFTICLYANQVTHQQAQELKKRVPLLDRSTAYIVVRVNVVILGNGEKELLFSSLLDSRISGDDLKTLYGLRWCKEENYKWYKVGMELEDFSGHSVLAIEQEVQALVFTANVASLVMQEAQEELDQEHGLKQLKHHYKINKRVAIGCMKDKLVKVLFAENGDISSFCASLKEEFKKNLCPVREGRKFKRVKKNKRKYGCTLRRCI